MRRPRFQERFKNHLIIIALFVIDHHPWRRWRARPVDLLHGMRARDGLLQAAACAAVQGHSPGAACAAVTEEAL